MFEFSLTDHELKHLRAHRYQSEGSSILDPYFNVFWNVVAKFVPSFIAPNMITLTGLFINLVPVVFALVDKSLYHLNNPDSLQYIVPDGVKVWFAVSVFLYQTLDAIDGKHARRLNLSTPLGELFDHGCDSVSTLLVNLITTLCIAPVDYTMTISCLAISVFASAMFFISCWQHFITGRLHFTKVNVTEAQVITIGMCLLPIYLGDQIFHLPILNMRLANIMAAFYYCSTLSITIKYLNRIVNMGCGRHGSSIANSSILTPSLPIFILCLVFVHAVTNSPSQVFYNNLVAASVFFGLAFAKISIKILVCTMTRTPFPAFDICLLPAVLLFFNLLFGVVVPEDLMLYFSNAYLFVDLAGYFYAVTNAFSRALNTPLLLL